MDDEAWGDIVVRAQTTKESDACAAVHRAVDGLRDSIDNHVLPAGPVIDRLIDIWSLARLVDPAAAKPAEAVLSAVAGRDAISADEVYAACDQIESALAGAGRAYAG
jgi:hypothetical protein